jgi:hypothetical protein
MFELHVQGFTETPTLDWVDVSSKMYSLKRLASMWRSDFHLNPVFEETLAVAIDPVYNSHSHDMQSVKCGIWWMYANYRLFIRGRNTNTKPPQTGLEQSFVLPANTSLGHTRSVVIDPLQDLAVAASRNIFYEADRCIFSVAFQLASSQRPHPDAVCTSLKCKHPCYATPGYSLHFVGQPAICGDRIVVLYYMCIISLERISSSNIFIQVIDWRKGRAKGVSLLYS